MSNTPVIASVAKRSRFFLDCFVAALLAMTNAALADTTQETQAKAIFRELRCVVCQGETIADSQADVAADMRREVRTQLKAGKSEAEILHYFSERYGDTVLMRTPFKAATALLWLAPLLLLAGAGAAAFAYFRRSPGETGR